MQALNDKLRFANINLITLIIWEIAKKIKDLKIIEKKSARRFKWNAQKVMDVTSWSHSIFNIDIKSIHIKISPGKLAINHYQKSKEPPLIGYGLEFASGRIERYSWDFTFIGLQLGRFQSFLIFFFFFSFLFRFVLFVWFVCLFVVVVVFLFCCLFVCLFLIIIVIIISFVFVFVFCFCFVFVFEFLKISVKPIFTLFY